MCYWVGIRAPQDMTPDRAVELAKEALSDAGMWSGEVEIIDAEVYSGALNIGANMELDDYAWRGQRSFEYSKGGVTVDGSR